MVEGNFELALKAPYENNGHEPCLAASKFIEILIEQPQSWDAFFEWVSARIESFTATQVLIESSLILTKLQRQKKEIVTMSTLMRYNWPSLEATLITHEFEVEKARIDFLVPRITMTFYTGINQM